MSVARILADHVPSPVSGHNLKNALILDADLGYAFWLGRGLDQAGYNAFPAKSAADASVLLDELRIAVDLLIVNPSVPGAAELIETVRRLSDRARVVAFSGDSHPARGSASADVYCRRPDRGSDFKRQEWVERVGGLLPVSLLPGLGLRLAPIAPLHPSSPASLAPLPSTETWRQWEREVLDGRFPLHRFLGSGERSAVFLTEYGDGAPQAAAIKILLADSWDAEILFSRWERAAAMSRPGLIRLFRTGKCRRGDLELQYVVMEYAEENLADVLRERALTAAEAREMLTSVVDTLARVHEQGYVLGHLKPSNIMAVADQVKIASDWLRPAGELTRDGSTPAVYDAPESIAGSLTPAADVWSLGVTLVEALTQRPPIRQRPKAVKVSLPAKLPGLFLDIACDCLNPNPARRETVAGLASLLRQPLPARRERMAIRLRGSFAPPGYSVPVIAAGMALSALLVPTRVPPAVSAPVPVSIPAQPQPVLPASPRTRQVIHQVLPEVPEAARQTIRGTLKVSVRTLVDSSGRVSQATIDSPGMSPYFEKLALKNAHGWAFEPLAGGVQSPAEEWTLQFAFTHAGASASFQPSR